MFAGFTWALLWQGVFGFLRSSFGGVIMAAASLALSFALMVSVGKTTALQVWVKFEREAKETAEKDLRQCRANTSELEEGLQRSRDAALAWQREVERRTREGEAEQERLRKAADLANDKARRTLAAKPSADLCKSLDLLMLESVR
jgi:hypothetical protein